ncbi:lymphocyte antigen 6H isoform X1 [Nannospalax galili]|uniref:lymphocyte antigen 6H isoform X1 n=1 Tax=Nannospalax galili TaxID=1026970 RepID=UPI000819E6A8|nr:lymphocyte antigen 6H isoform X1 [Nannospalax galili]
MVARGKAGRGDRRAPLPAPRPPPSPECGHPRDVSAPPTPRPALHAPIRGTVRSLLFLPFLFGRTFSSPGREDTLPTQACTPEDPLLRCPRLPQACPEHAARGHEEPWPGAAGLAVVPRTRTGPVVSGLHSGQLQPLHSEAVPAHRHRLCQCPDHRHQQQQEGSFREQDVCFLL